jgi:hypothetical protein
MADRAAVEDSVAPEQPETENHNEEEDEAECRVCRCPAEEGYVRMLGEGRSSYAQFTYWHFYSLTTQPSSVQAVHLLWNDWIDTSRLFAVLATGPARPLQ